MTDIRLAVFCQALLVCSFAHAQCSVATVRVKGKVEHVAPGTRVRVQLIYPKKEHEESAEADVEGNAFNIPVEFLTQSRRGLINNLGEKCSRKPKAVVVSVINGEKEAGSISLDFFRDFEKSDASAYTIKREILLQGQER